MQWVIRLLLGVALAGLWPLCARAHQPGLSTLVVQLRTNTLDADLIVSWQEIDGIVSLDLDQDRQLSDDEFAAAQARLLTLASNAVAFESDGSALVFSRAEAKREDTTGVHFTLRCEFPATRVLLVRSEIIGDFPRGHHQIVTVRGATNETLAEYAMTQDRNLIEVPLTPGAERMDHSIRGFLWLGVEHILIGWDHLAFLFGLMVVGARGREVVKIVTAFTVAHSLTLALATFNLIRIPSAVVEAVIAASIVYVGIENMVRREHRGRWMVAFGFGLIHGCGFATVLRELGVGADGMGVVKPLVCFNAGVEAGQLAIAAAVLPWIWKLKGRFGQRWVVAASVAVALIGAWFLLERTVL